MQGDDVGAPRLGTGTRTPPCTGAPLASSTPAASKGMPGGVCESLGSIVITSRSWAGLTQVVLGRHDSGGPGQT